MGKSKMKITDIGHLNYNCRKLLDAATGARDMLFEAEKQFRLNGDKGHSDMCRLHKEELNIFVDNK